MKIDLIDGVLCWVIPVEPPQDPRGRLASKYLALVSSISEKTAQTILNSTLIGAIDVSVYPSIGDES